MRTAIYVLAGMILLAGAAVEAWLDKNRMDRLSALFLVAIIFGLLALCTALALHFGRLS